MFSFQVNCLQSGLTQLLPVCWDQIFSLWIGSDRSCCFPVCEDILWQGSLCITLCCTAGWWVQKKNTYITFPQMWYTCSCNTAQKKKKKKSIFWENSSQIVKNPMGILSPKSGEIDFKLEQITK